MPDGNAYNPSDPVQSAFLSALALGETGSHGGLFEGVGGSNLGGAPVDEYGFPQWQGEGNSHAAGTYQFEPGTWDAIASKYGLNFSNSADQNAGAWYLAQETYSKNNGGQSLEDALQNGEYSSVQSALSKVWPSVTGNGAAPGGLANDLSQGIGASIPVDATAAPVDGGSSTTGNASGGLFSDIENWFIRGGLILIGGIVVALALWALLAHENIVPEPSQVVKAIAA